MGAEGGEALPPYSSVLGLPLSPGSLCPLPEFRLNAVIPSSGLSGVPSIFMMLQAKINT